jgi:hypothetical protein
LWLVWKRSSGIASTRVVSRVGGSTPTDDDKSVFINCPFDDAYLPLFRALVFAVFECGLNPRCAQEVYDAGEVRVEKIMALIRDCRCGIHDISRTDLNLRNLPRFNMPLELGLYPGAKRFGSGPQRHKSCLVLDRDKFRYQDFISDILGQDIAAHDDDPVRAIEVVREWLAISRAGVTKPAGATAIGMRYAKFSDDLPAICSLAELHPAELTFVEYADIASTWLRAERSGRA